MFYIFSSLRAFFAGISKEKTEIFLKIFRESKLVFVFVSISFFSFGQLINETFTNSIPGGWTIVNGTSISTVASNSSFATGTAYEANIDCNSAGFTSTTTRLYYGPINTTGMTSLNLSWLNYLDHYSSGYSYGVSVQTSSNGTTWNNTTWVTNPVTADITAGPQSITISNSDVGSSTFYLSFTLDGFAFGCYDWFIDNVLLNNNVPCSGIPNNGTAAISSSSGCTGANFTLSATGLSTDVGMSYQWQSSSSASGPWSPIAGANSGSYTTSVASVGTTYYQLISTCTNSGQSATSSVVSFTIVGDACTCSSYCIPIQDYSSSITNVTINTLNNTSSYASPYYSFESATTTLVMGNSYTLTLTSTTDFGAISSVWFDWDGSGTFDASEWYQIATNSSLASITITVPPSTVSTVRMRIRTRNYGSANGPTDACTLFYSGETEDYCLTVVAPVACSSAPSTTANISSSSGCSGATINLSATGIPIESGFTYQWQSAPTASGPWTDISGATNATLTTSTTSNTFYHLVITCTNGGATATSTNVSYTITGDQCNCGSYSSNYSTSTAGDADLSNVTVGSMNNNSTCGDLAPGTGSIAGRYANYTGSVTGPSAIIGSNVSFSLTNTCYSNNRVFFQIYIDWDQDGTFATSEMMYQSASIAGANTTVTGSFTIPLTAAIGITRMRVIHIQSTNGNYSAATNYAQTDYNKGETEDYCFTVMPNCTVSISPTTTTICSGQSTNLSSTASYPSSSETPTYTWSSSPSGYSANTQNVTVSPTLTTTYTLSAVYSACTATATSTVTVINPTVSVNSPTVCSGQSAIVTATPSIAGTYTYAWTVPAGASDPGNVASFTTTIAGTYTVVVTGPYCTFTNSGTVSTETPFTLAGSWDNSVICSSQTATYTVTPSTPGAYSYAWTVPGGVTNPGNTNAITTGTAGTYSVTATLGACTATSSSSLTVNASNTITLTSATNTPTFCTGSSATITYSSTNATGATYSGLPAGMSGNFNAGVITLSGTITDVPGNYPYTVTLTGGCPGLVVSASGTITVLASNLISNTGGSLTNTLCLGASLSQISFSTSSLTGLNVTGLPSGTSSSSGPGTTTINGTPTAIGNYNFTVVSNEGCTSSGNITVNGNNTITLTSAAGTNSQTICRNSPITSITYATTAATGASISWSPSTPTGITGSWSADVYTISGTPTVAGTFNYTITTTGGCGTAVVATGSLTVNSLPTVTGVSTVATTCSNLNQSAVFTISGTSGTTVSYTLNGTPGSVTLSSSYALVTIPSVTTTQTMILTSVSNGTCSTTPSGSSMTATTLVSNTCQPMTECNLAVLRIGNGSTTLSASSTAAFDQTVQERLVTDGSNNTSIDWSSNFSGSNLLTNEGNASSVSTGFLNSYNGILGVPGYTSAATTTSVSTQNTKAASLISGISGTLISRTSLPTSAPIPFNSQTFRSVLPVTSTTFYAAGSGTSSSGGIWYVDITNASSPVYTQLFVTTGSVRNLEIYNGTLYFSGTSINSTQGIFQLGTAGTLPTSGSPAVTTVISYTGAVPGGFAISPDGCTIYIADASNLASRRGINKWSNSTGTWTMVGSVYTPTNASSQTSFAFGLTADFSGTENKIYYTAGYVGTPALVSSQLIPNFLFGVKETGNGTTATWTPLFTPVSAGTNMRFAGVDFSPNSYKPFNITTNLATSNSTTCVGAATTLSVATDYIGTVNYQWYKNTSSSSLCSSGWVAVGSNSPDFTFTPSTAGTEYYYVKIWTSCASVKISNVATMIIGSGTPITASITPSSSIPICAGSNVVLTANGANGTTPYTYSWSSGEAVSAITVSTNAVYTVTVTSADGCTANASITITSSPNPTINAVASACVGAAADISVTATGGTAPFNVSWSGTASGNPAGTEIANSGESYSIPNLGSGTYDITVIDANNCTAAQADISFTCSSCTNPTIDTQASTITECINDTQQLSIVASGSALTYQWYSNTTNINSGGTSLGSSNGAQTATYTPASLSAGTVYYYCVVSSSTCTATSDVVIVLVNSDNTVGLPSANPTLCLGATISPNITIATSGATGIGTPTGLPTGVSTSWSGDVITISGTPSSSGTFNYSIPLSGGCGSINASGTITVNLLPIISGTASTCINSTTQLTGSPTAAASNPWTSSNTGVATISNVGLVTGTGEGSTTITYTNTDGCSTTVSVTVSDIIDWANLQSPTSGTICVGGTFDIYGQLYNTGAVNTTIGGSAATGVTVDFGYNASNTNPSTWTNWSTATFNPGGGGANNDEYSGTFTGLPVGTFYYTFRYQINGCGWQYGGYSNAGGGFWNGTSYVSGVLTVNAAPSILFISPP